uniref:Endonuclease/exonuclease/phosphatase domain-containing protein n=1 Tax=Tetranychus urticae TaxID=32264 RepID=T1KBH3_TETUR
MTARTPKFIEKFGRPEICQLLFEQGTSDRPGEERSKPIVFHHTVRIALTDILSQAQHLPSCLGNEGYPYPTLGDETLEKADEKCHYDGCACDGEFKNEKVEILIAHVLANNVLVVCAACNTGFIAFDDYVNHINPDCFSNRRTLIRHKNTDLRATMSMMADGDDKMFSHGNTMKGTIIVGDFNADIDRDHDAIDPEVRNSPEDNHLRNLIAEFNLKVVSTGPTFFNNDKDAKRFDYILSTENISLRKRLINWKQSFEPQSGFCETLAKHGENLDAQRIDHIAANFETPP